MTLQQLHYIIAVDRHRSFAKAAEACAVTQPTLSKMVANLEEELDVRIFDRSNRHVSTTAIGRDIIDQAIRAVAESRRIKEIIDEAKGRVSGSLRLAIGPSIAPYILPEFIRQYTQRYDEVTLTIEEMRPETMSESLLADRIDAGVAIGGEHRDGIFEIPLYTEPFWVYLSEDCRLRPSEFTPASLSHRSMWVMKEAQCLRQSAFSFCKARETGRRVYEAGNIETLVRVVDANGGFTIIPEMHLPFLSERQRANVRPLAGEFTSRRRVSLYIRSDFIREAMLNSIVSTFAAMLPEHMAEATLRRPGGIRL